MTPLNILDAEETFNAGKLTPTAFNGRARTFARLLGVWGNDRPYEHTDIYDEAGVSFRSYRMKPDITWLIVLSPGDGHTVDDLHELINPPSTSKGDCDHQNISV